MTANPSDDAADRPAGILLTYRETPVPARILIFGMLVNRLGSFLPIFLVLYLTSRGYSAQDAGLALGAYGLGGILGGVAGGWLTDRLGCRRTIVYSAGAAGVLTAAIFYAPGLAAVFVLVVVVGTVSYGYRPASSALLAAMVPQARYTMVFAMYRLAMNLGTAAGPLVGALLIRWSFGVLFWVEALVLLAFAVSARFLLPADDPTAGRVGSADGTAPARSWQLLADHRFVVFLVSVFAVSAVYFQYLSTVPLQVIADGFTTGVYATLVTVNAVIVAGFELPFTKVVQRWSPRTALVVNYLLIGAGMAMYSTGQGLAALLLATVTWSVGEIVGAPTFFSYPAKVAPEGMRGRYLGAAGAMMSLAMAVGPALGAPLWTALGSRFWLVCGGVCLLSAVAAYAGVRRDPSSPAANVQTPLERSAPQT